LLESTGAGHTSEWFWHETEAELRAEWGVSGEREYLERVLEAGTAGGVFGAKVMWGTSARRSTGCGRSRGITS
jgi:hypothetical protein